MLDINDKIDILSTISLQITKHVLKCEMALLNLYVSIALMYVFNILVIHKILKDQQSAVANIRKVQIRGLDILFKHYHEGKRDGCR